MAHKDLQGTPTLYGSIQPPADHKYIATEVIPGLFVVKNAYEGEYDFFAPSPLLDLDNLETKLDKK